jgi:hypothetical protein
LVEINIPFCIVGIEVSLITPRDIIELIKGLMHEIVQFIAAVEIATPFTWAWCYTGLGVRVIGVGTVSTAIAWARLMATSGTS